MMQVQKRNGDYEEVSFDKVLNRIKVLTTVQTPLSVNIFEVAQKVCGRIFDGVKTSDLDELAAQICSSMMLEHPDYGTMASRIIISNHHKNTSPSFSETIQILYDNGFKEGAQDIRNNLVSDDVFNVVMANKEKLNSFIDYSRDYNFDYFGFKTLEKAYLIRVNGKVIERPQQMLMRVALGVHGNDVKDALNTYDLMSKQYFTHATPTLFNSGTPRPQNSSCFLGGVHEDSINCIYDTLKEAALISKYAGGIGIHIHGVRARNSVIRGTNGSSTGIVPMLRVFNNTARYVNQCFTPETMICTVKGTKAIEDVKLGDHVQTSDGTYKPVLSVFKNKVQREILEFNSKYLVDPVRVTKEHRILVLDVDKQKERWIYADQFDMVRHRLGYIDMSVESEEIEEIEESDESEEIEESDESDESEEESDANILRFYGIFLVHGRFIGENSYITCNSETTFTEVLKHLTNCGISHVVYRSSTRMSKTVRWMSDASWTSIIKESMVYEDDKEIRRICPHYIEYVSCSKRRLAYLLMGMSMDSDNKYIEIRSRIIAQDIQFMCTRMFGVPLPVHKSVDERYVITMNAQSDRTIMLAKSKVWLSIDSVRTIPYSGLVYDLNIKDNHNYTTSMGIVHNSGRRNGSIAVYLEPWHADIEAFLELRKNNGNEEDRARDLFYALWIPDLFMKRVREDGTWSLMCPDACRGLADVFGDEFERLYESYERDGKYIKQVKAQDLWFKVLEAQIETGVPYMLYKDHVNKKNNQANLGTIKSSNLCVAPDTYVMTDAGNVQIDDLAEQCKRENGTVNVWNGVEFSPVVVFKTGEDVAMYTVTLSNGSIVHCTAYHKFYLDNGTVKAARDLVTNDVIEKYKTPLLENTIRYGDISDRIQFAQQFKQHVVSGCLAMTEENGPEKWENLYMLKEALYTLGTKPSFTGSDVLVGYSDILKLCKLGFVVDKDKALDQTREPTSVIWVQGVSMFMRSDTYCFKEPKRGRGMFNNVVTGNCTEIVEFTSGDEWAVCNLASLCLPTYIEDGVYNFGKLHDVVKVVVKNLNKIIDGNFYPIEKAKNSNLLHRPIGLGVQGLADAFVILRLPFDSEEAAALNVKIFETIYHAALEASMELAQKMGPYKSYEGSPTSKGILQFDMWNVVPSDRYCWAELREKIKAHGLLNSLLVAPMPTASTSQICGFNECFEPFTSNIYKRKTLAGEFILVNKYLIADLQKLGLWNADMKNRIILAEGSIQGIEGIPKDIKDIYKIVWEIKQKVIIDMAADRGAFVDQSQSMNLFMENPDFKKLSSMHFYAWQKGLKTGMYYLRSKAKARAQQFTMDPKLCKYTNIKEEMGEGGCESCSG